MENEPTEVEQQVLAARLYSLQTKAIESLEPRDASATVTSLNSKLLATNRRIDPPCGSQDRVALGHRFNA